MLPHLKTFVPWIDWIYKIVKERGAKLEQKEHVFLKTTEKVISQGALFLRNIRTVKLNLQESQARRVVKCWQKFANLLA